MSINESQGARYQAPSLTAASLSSPSTPPNSCRSLENPRQSASILLRPVPFKLSFDETNLTVKLYGVWRAKPEKRCHISSSATRAPHAAETSDENSKRRFLFLTISSLFCHTRHSNSFSIRQFAKPWESTRQTTCHALSRDHHCFHAPLGFFTRSSHNGKG